MKKYCRTDLACEAFTDISHTSGVEHKVEEIDCCIAERIKITSKDAAKRLGKKIGSYTTFTMPRLQYLDEKETEKIAEIIGDELRSTVCKLLQKKSVGRDLSVLVVGLGNSGIISDAIGPQTVDRLTATRHLIKLNRSLFNSLNLCSIAAIAPDVLGNTGIESADIVSSVVAEIHPDIIIAIDALAARAAERLARTVQISDTGITPGAGIGNIRGELSKESLGIPVIAIGVPTVINSATLVFNVLSEAGLTTLHENTACALEAIENLFVTPKETDIITKSFSALLSSAINRAFVIS